MTQLEISIETTFHALKLANQHKVTTIFNPGFFFPFLFFFLFPFLSWFYESVVSYFPFLILSSFFLAPAVALPSEIFPYIDILSPNETELEILTGLPVQSVEDAKVAAKKLLDL